VDQKIVVMGGWNLSWKAMIAVFIYDFTSCTWCRGADMPRVRSFFACSVSPDGLIYVAGGHDENKNALWAAEDYDVEEDKWEILPPMSQERDECQGVFMDGKFTVISGYTTESQGRFERSAEVFDPSTGVWSRVENMWSIGGCPRACVAALGHLYFFHNKQVLSYNSKENVWEVVGCLPECMNVATCATVWGNKIFVSGSAYSVGEQVCYMFDSKEGNSTRWVPTERPHDFVGIVQSAITVEV
jgi:N-acetylneuraminic acid mutarotase